MAEVEQELKEQPEEFIKTVDVVRLFGGKLTPEYISTLVKEGILPAYRFKKKGHLFFRLSEVEEAMRVKGKKELSVEE